MQHVGSFVEDSVAAMPAIPVQDVVLHRLHLAQLQVAMPPRQDATRQHTEQITAERAVQKQARLVHRAFQAALGKIAALMAAVAGAGLITHSVLAVRLAQVGHVYLIVRLLEALAMMQQ